MTANATNRLRLMRMHSWNNGELAFPNPRGRPARFIPEGNRAVGGHEDHGAVVPMPARSISESAASDQSAMLASVEKAG